MSLGMATRLARIFSSRSGRLFGVAVDHFVGYGDVRRGGLADLPAALGRTMSAQPDSVTMQPGTAKALWPAYAGRAALIVQAGCFTADDRIHELIATPEDAIRMGADAIAVAIPVNGATEGMYLKWLTDTVRDAARFGLPVVAHIYPRDVSGVPRIEFTPDGIAWAVRCGIETGVDVIKVGYPGGELAFKQIIDSCPVPVVAAGGPRAETLKEALEQTAAALRAGAKGAVVGRNIWDRDDVVEAARAYKAVIHEDVDPSVALQHALASTRA
jgi:class I fructose-bisphosphate aldolase